MVKSGLRAVQKPSRISDRQIIRLEWSIPRQNGSCAAVPFYSSKLPQYGESKRAASEGVVVEQYDARQLWLTGFKSIVAKFFVKTDSSKCWGLGTELHASICTHSSRCYCTESFRYKWFWCRPTYAAR